MQRDRLTAPAEFVNQCLTRPQRSFLLVDTRDKGTRGVQERRLGTSQNQPFNHLGATEIVLKLWAGQITLSHFQSYF